MTKNLSFILLVLCSIFYTQSFAQITTGELTGEVNTITSAVPFLTIAPDSRGGGMGDAGVSTSPDVYSQHYNAAKYPFSNKDFEISLSYTPWLRSLINDIDLAYLVGYFKLNKTEAVSASLRYFSLGNIVFTDIYGNQTGQFNPNEFAIDVGYSRLLSRKFSGAVTLRYIYSNLTGGQMVEQTTETHPGHAIAADVGFYWRTPLEIQEKDARFAWGIQLSNVGSKISYTDDAQKDFIPQQLRLGADLEVEFDDYNSIEITAEAQKLLVPTPPIYEYDSILGDDVISAGKDPNISSAAALFQSWYDAPGITGDAGDVFQEEMHELTYSLGLEYWYAKQFAIRTGYFHEHSTKGNRKFFTVGLGLRLNVFGVDFSYLIPTQQRNPLENTLRVSLILGFETFNQSAESKSKLPNQL